MVVEALTEATAAEPVDTAALEVETPPALEQPETLTSDAPETELEEAPETAQESAKSWADHLADVDEDELVNNDRIKSILARREESTRRRIERDQQLRAGQSQQAQATLTYLMQRLESGDITGPQFRQAAAQVYQAAEYANKVELAQKLPDALMGNYKIPLEYREKATDLKASAPGDIDGYLRILVEGAVASERGTTRLKDVPEGSPLHKDIQAEVTKRFEAELRAAGVATQPRLQTPPQTPRGGNSAGNQSINSMIEADKAFNEGRIKLPEYKQYRERFGVARAPGGR